MAVVSANDAGLNAALGALAAIAAVDVDVLPLGASLVGCSPMTAMEQ